MHTGRHNARMRKLRFISIHFTRIPDDCSFHLRLAIHQKCSILRRVDWVAIRLYFWFFSEYNLLTAVIADPIGQFQFESVWNWFQCFGYSLFSLPSNFILIIHVISHTNTHNRITSQWSVVDVNLRCSIPQPSGPSYYSIHILPLLIINSNIEL